MRYLLHRHRSCHRQPGVLETPHTDVGQTLLPREQRALTDPARRRRIALLRYSPIRGTLEGKPLEILPCLGTSRLVEPLNRHPLDAVFHGHAHHGTPVYNVAMPLLLQKYPDRPPFRVVELPEAPPSETEAALRNARETAGSKRPPIVERRGTDHR